MRRWLPAFVIALDFSFAAWAYRHLPELISPRWDLWVPWRLPAATEALPRVLVAVAPPIASLVVWLLLATLASPAGERLGRRLLPSWLVSARTGTTAVERFSPTFTTIIVAIVACTFFIHVGAVATFLDWPVWIVRASLAATGLAAIIVGNVMPRTRPNFIAGLRTKRAMSSPDVWRTTHRRFGALLMVTGGAVILTAMLATPYTALVGIVGLLASAIVASVSARDGGGSADARRSSTSVVVMVLALLLPVRLPAHNVVASSPIARPFQDEATTTQRR